MTSTETPIEPGLQLYTLRELLAKDYRGTLEKVAAIGYREVQVSGRAGHAPGEIRSMLDGLGLRAPSTHLEGPPEQEIEAAHALGARYVFLSAPRQVVYQEKGEWRIRTDLSLDDWKAIASELNAMGEAFSKAGLVFGYHNHHFEFTPVEGRLPYDVILEETDPERVRLEIDLGWAKAAGFDPLPAFARFPGRFPVCHVKDVLADGTFVDPGEGTVPFEAIFARAGQAGLRHYFVEHDTAPDPLATARAGYAYLKGRTAGA